MERYVQVGLLTLGFSLVFLSANEVGTPVQLYGINPWENVTEELKALRAEKLQLEENLTRPEYEETRSNIKQELQRVNDKIQKLEGTARVLYGDYKRSLEEQRQFFQNEKETLRRKLSGTKSERMDTIRLKGKIESNQDEQDSDTFQQKLVELNREKEQITVEYAALTALQYQQQHTMNKQMSNIILERKEMKRKLVHAQDLHSRALEAMAIATLEDYKPISIPHQNEIDELRAEMRKHKDTGLQGTELNRRLLSTQGKLEALLKILYEEGALPTDAAFKEIENDLAQIEKNAIRVRDQYDKRRQDIIQSMKKKSLSVYDEEEIISLKTTNQQIVDTNKDLQEIARRSAYLKAISQVNDMITECSSKIRDAMIRTTEASQVEQQQQTVISEDQCQNDEEFYEDPERIYDMIHQQYLLYKDLNELYRNKLSTQIVVGLAKVNGRFPIPFPGCNTNQLREIRNQVDKWADGVQYALRLTKSLNKGGYRSMIARYFVDFLKSLRNAFRKLLGSKTEEESNLEDDDDVTTSIEMFEDQENIEFNDYFEYITTHLNVLDATEEIGETELKEFRYNFIFVKKAPEVIQETALRMFHELRNDSDEANRGKQLVAFGEVLKDMEALEKRLRQLFITLMSKVKTTLEEKEHEYQVSLEEYKKCRYEILKNMPIFRNLAK